MKLIYCLLLLLCPYGSRAQGVGKELGIGDAMPMMVCNNVLNHGAATIDLAKYKGKVLVLDFMVTGCVGCLHKLPDYDSLQKAFGGKLQFVIVTSQATKAVRQFLQGHRLGKLVSFPVITNDRRLRALFPYEYISHMVVIGPDGMVKAITHGEYITAANMQKVFDGRPINLPVKKDVPGFDYSRLLLELNQPVRRMSKAAAYHSAMLPYLPEVGGNALLFVKDTLTHTVRTAFYNRGILDLYLQLNRKIEFPHTQVVLQVRDSARYILDESRIPWHDWMADHSYCYEAVLPDTMTETAQRQQISRELDFYLGLQAKMEQREMDCLLLRRRAVAMPVKLPEGEESYSLATIVFELNQVFSGLPVLIDGNIDEQLRLPLERSLLRNRTALEPILQQAGYELVTVRRTVETLVITETNFINH